MLDPTEAEGTLGELAVELERIGPEAEARLHRQREIAAELRRLLDP